MNMRTLTSWMPLVLIALVITGCGDAANPQAAGGDGKTAAGTGTPVKVLLQLNWVAEPEFGGFYAARDNGHYRQAGLEVEIRAGGAGSNVIQMVERGTVPFGIVSADEIIIARAKGSDLVGVFATYQNCPQGIMVHQDQGYATLVDLFTPKPGAKPITLAAEPGLAYVKYLQHKFGNQNLKVVPYTYNIQPFMQDKQLAQQCFITSEPILARRQGAKVTVFTIGDSGFDPYTAVVAVRQAYLKKQPQIVRAFVQATQNGWRDYLDDPSAANAVMGKLNTNMDSQTFTQAAAAQAPLIENAFTRQHGLGAMETARWKILAQQLVDIKVIESIPDPAGCYVNLADIPAKP